MTGRKRVWAALQGNPLDRPPKGEIFIAPELLKQLPHPDLQAVLACLNADLVVLPVNRLNPTPAIWKSWSKSNYFVFGILQGPITFLAEGIGWHKLSQLLLKNTEEAREIIRKYITESFKPVMVALEAGCEGIVIADDLAGSYGPLISAVLLEKIYFPTIALLVQELNFNRVPSIFHSDGNILKLVSYLKETGFWGIHGLQPSAGIGPESFCKQNLKNWVYWGNFEFEGPGGLKNVSDVEAGVRALLEKWSGFPGYIFGSSGGLYKGLVPQVIKVAYGIVDSWEHKRKT